MAYNNMDTEVENENRLLKQFRVLSQLLEEIPAELTDGEHVKSNMNYAALEMNGLYKQLRLQEEHVCREIAIKSLIMLSDCIFNGDLPCALRLEAETEGITDIFHLFAPGVNGRLKVNLLERLPVRLQVIARIMGFVLQKFSTGKCTYNLGEYHPNICKRVVREMVTMRFGLSRELADRIHEFIDSDPNYGGVPIFCASDDDDSSKIDWMKWVVQRYEDRIQVEQNKIAEALLEAWESD